MIWQNIENCKIKLTNSSSSSTIVNECNPSVGDESNLVIHADCHSANKGLFSGMVVLVLCVVTIILFFIAISDE